MSESATPEYEEGMICPSCLQRVGSEFVKLHADCMFMVFDVSCLGREEGVHPYERAAMLAYARACAKDRPEVARLIRLRVRLDLRGHSLRAINQKGRIFVTSKSAPEVLSNPNVVCGDVRRFPQAAEGTVARRAARPRRSPPARALRTRQVRLEEAPPLRRALREAPVGGEAARLGAERQWGAGDALG